MAKYEKTLDFLACPSLLYILRKKTLKMVQLDKMVQQAKMVLPG